MSDAKLGALTSLAWLAAALFMGMVVWENSYVDVSAVCAAAPDIGKEKGDG